MYSAPVLTNHALHRRDERSHEDGEFLTPNLKAMGGKKLSAAPQSGAGPRRLSLGLLDGSPHRRSAHQGGGLAVPASMEDAIEEV